MNKNKIPEKKKKHVVREYIEALLTAALIALVIRAFVIEAFKIPSGSMIPTLSIGDHIFVNKFIYGLRIPFTKKRYLEFREPHRGEIIVFIYPLDESKDFIKRVIGLPGDEILVKDTEVFVNGVQIPHEEVHVTKDPEYKRRLKVDNSDIKHIPYEPDFANLDFFLEEYNNTKYIVQYEKGAWRREEKFKVPQGMYFVIGDNRDNSADSRDWGFIPKDNIKGRAMFVWLSLDKDQGGIRWHEFGRWIE